MAVWNEISCGNLNPGLDLSAEHYHPDKLNIQKMLLSQEGCVLNECVDFPREICHPSGASTPVFDLSAAQSHVLRIENSQTEDRVSSKKIAFSGDVIISRLRSYLKQVAVIHPELEKVFLSTEFLVLRKKHREDIAFLVPFLLSDSVQTILTWSQDGNEHPRFNENILKRLPVPRAILSISNDLNTYMQKIVSASDKSYSLLYKAEILLLEELGLNNIDFSPSLFYERTFFETKKAKRLDAEYFQPKYQSALNILSKDNLAICDVASLTKRPFSTPPDKFFNYIEIGGVRSNGFAESNECSCDQIPSRAKWVVRPGDVITTTVRPIRRLSALIKQNQDGYTCSSGFAVLKPKTVPSELLLLYLRLPIICEIMDLCCSASMYPAISVDDLLKLPFLKPSDSAIVELVKLVQESRTALKKSQSLLQEAEKMTEAAILGVTK